MKLLIFMPFSKSFPKQVNGVTQWIEVTLTDAEEQEVEQASRDDHIRIFKECLDDAKTIMQAKNLKDYQTDQVSIAVSLFEKRGSHTVFHKEARAKQQAEPACCWGVAGAGPVVS